MGLGIGTWKGRQSNPLAQSNSQTAIFWWEIQINAKNMAKLLLGGEYAEVPHIFHKSYFKTSAEVKGPFQSVPPPPLSPSPSSPHLFPSF
jgi:hypothetical protein